MRLQTFTTFTLLLLLASGCGGGPSKRAQAPSKAPARTCAAGAFRHLGSSKLAYAAVVRSQATAFTRPGGRVLARFGRLNQNGVPTVFAIRGDRKSTRLNSSHMSIS